MADKEITNQDIMDMLTVLVERTNKMGELDKKITNIDSDIKKLKTDIRDLKLDNENNIKPTLQAILENQTEVINQKSKITEVEEKHDKLKDRVDVIEYAVKENQNEIEKLKKRA